VNRELLVLGTSSAVPTRNRNHNGYLLRWDGHGLLFDPGEGTQRQLGHAGVAASDLGWICVSHFHGDHCLGVPGIVQRIARDGVDHPVHAVFPSSGAAYWERLRNAAIFHDTADIPEHPLAGPTTLEAEGFTLTALPLDHRVESYGYRLVEPDGVTMLPDALEARGVRGPQIGRLQAEGVITTPAGQVVRLEECSVPRPGQKFAFVMDTRLCDAAYALADSVDLLVIESTYLDDQADQAHDRGHLTAGQAARVAAASGARALVLTHFSERYRAADEALFHDQAAAVFDGEVHVAHDLDRIPLPPRRRSTA
jgi:ribonuclease Z